LYSSPSIIGIIKSWMMRWAGHVARKGEKRNAYRLLVGKPEGKGPLGRSRRRWVHNITNIILLLLLHYIFILLILLEWILGRWDGVMWTGLVWLRIGTGGELL
jgi:hypothetical protein